MRRQTWATGRVLTPWVIAAVSATGVSRTTVASRLKTVVTRAASRKVPVSSRTGLARLHVGDQRAGRA